MVDMSSPGPCQNMLRTAVSAASAYIHLQRVQRQLAMSRGNISTTFVDSVEHL